MTIRNFVLILTLAVFAISTDAQVRKPVKKTTTRRTAAVRKAPAKSAAAKTAVLQPANAIDLGLPSGTKWADRNVGAKSPEDYGGLYRYGNRGKGDGSGTPRQENIIGTQYDVAKSKMGSKWHLPSIAQLQELMDNCEFQLETVNKVSGYRVTGPNGNTIFLPLTGIMYSYGRSQAGQFAMYVSGERVNYDMFVNGEVASLELWGPKDDNPIRMGAWSCGAGNPVRAVTE